MTHAWFTCPHASADGRSGFARAPAAGRSGPVIRCIGSRDAARQVDGRGVLRDGAPGRAGGNPAASGAATDPGGVVFSEADGREISLRAVGR